MKLTKAEQLRVEDNMGLVYKVIGDKVKGPFPIGSFTREDLIQVGAIGLCKAVATDKGGTFSTYAYRLIWNEICDALSYATRRQAHESPSDELADLAVTTHEEAEAERLQEDIVKKLHALQQEVSPSISKGISAILLRMEGYSGQEIANLLGASSNLVCAWISKARKYLRQYTELYAQLGGVR